MSKSEQSADKSGVRDHSTRRLQQLVDENSHLRQYVADVMHRLRENERLFARLFELETKVLAASDVEILCFTLLKSLRKDFELDMTRFWLNRSVLAAGRQMTSLSGSDIAWLDSGDIQKAGLVNKRVCLMPLSVQHRFKWLGAPDEHLGSLALLVLGDLASPFGVLGLGSVDTNRFRPDRSTDFLYHLAQIVSLGLENALSRERLDRLASGDSLTGGKDMRFLQPYSHQLLSQWFGRDIPVACLYMDIDGWKDVREKHGQQTADDMLSTVSAIVQSHTRVRDPLMRMNESEFALLLPACSRQKAMQVSKHVSKDCKAAEIAGAVISLSIGLACCNTDADIQVRSLIESAEQAMYVAKALGGGRLEAEECD